MGWKYYDGCATIPLDRVELVPERRKMEKEEGEEEYLEEQSLRGHKSRWRRIWDSL